MERSAAYIEISQRPDGHTVIGIYEGVDFREVDVGFAPLDHLEWMVLKPSSVGGVEVGRKVRVDVNEIIRKAFWAGYSHASYRAAEWHSKQPAWLKRKLKESK